MDKYDFCGSSKEASPSPNIFSEFYLDCDMAHGLDDCDCNSTTKNKDAFGMCTVTCPYHSDFGVPTNTSQAATYDYIAARGATFFQAILGGASSSMLSNHSKFVECENYRNTCSTTNYDNSCTNDNVCP